jgi:hypothetical protein
LKRSETPAIRRILDHLGLSPPEKPPPDVREIVRVPVDDEGRRKFDASMEAKWPGRGHAGILAWLVEGWEGSEASHR